MGGGPEGKGFVRGVNGDLVVCDEIGRHFFGALERLEFMCL